MKYLFVFFKTLALGLLQTNNSKETFFFFSKYLHIFSALDPDPEANKIIFFKFNLKPVIINKITEL